MSQPSHNPNRWTNPFDGRSTRRSRRAVAAAVGDVPIERLEQRLLLSVALAGQLDPTFGAEGDGIVGTAIGDYEIQNTVIGNTTGTVNTYFDEANGVAVEPGGKIIVVGTSLNTNIDGYNPLTLDLGDPTNNAKDPIKESYNFAVARYLPDGQLDTTFGDVVDPDNETSGDGYLISDFDNAATRSSKKNAADTDSIAYRVAVLPNNDILVAGLEGPSVAIANDWDVCVAVYDQEGLQLSNSVLAAPLASFGDWALVTPVATNGQLNNVDFYVGGSLDNIGTGYDLQAYEVQSPSAAETPPAARPTVSSTASATTSSPTATITSPASPSITPGISWSAANPTLPPGIPSPATPISSSCASAPPWCSTPPSTPTVSPTSSTSAPPAPAPPPSPFSPTAISSSPAGATTRRRPPLPSLGHPRFHLRARGIVPLGQLFPTNVNIVPDGQILVMGGNGSPADDGLNATDFDNLG